MKKTTDRLLLLSMQQYFTDKPLKVGERYIFTKEQAKHAFTVLKMNHDRIRLVYDGMAFFADAYKDGNECVADILEEDPRNNELDIDITLAVALIRREKMELVLLKAAELGASRIVPFESERCVVKNVKEKDARRKERWQAILQEGSEQCKRNRIPELSDTISIKKLDTVKSECNVAAYENAYGENKLLTKAAHGKSITVVIGPEGGFSNSEVDLLNSMGYESVSLGSRILRAETACFYALSVLGEWSEANEVFSNESGM